MCKINMLNLYSESGECINSIPFTKTCNYIYSKNSSGKTKMVELIDYMLGSTSIIIDNITFKGIRYIELILEKFYLKRTVEGTCYFKLRKDDAYDEVSINTYKDRIENMLLNGNYEDTYLIKNISDQDISHRTYTIFNFLNQKHQGIIDKNIFTKQNNLEYFRAKYIFKYIFNRNNYIEINKLKNQLSQDSKLLEKNTITEREINFLEKSCEEIFCDLGLKYNKDIDKNIEYVLSLKKERKVIKPSVINSDYYSLLTMLNQIENKIQYLESRIKQDEIQTNINEKKIILLDSLKKFTNNEQYNYLVEPIINKIEKIDMLNNIVSIQDYKSVLKEMKKKKNIILLDINSISKNANQEKEYMERESKIEEVYRYLKRIKGMNISNSQEIIERMKKTRNRISELESTYDVNMENKISQKINNYYSFFKGKNYDFVDDDYTNPTFKLKYNSKKNSVLSYVTEHRNGEDFEVVRMIGSMARQTLIQVCVYLAFFETINEEFHFPIMKTIVMDCISKSFDDKNKKMIYELINYYCKNNKDVNFIVMTDTKSDAPNRFELTRGLNPLY